MELHLKVALFVLYQISKSYVTFISSCFKYPGKFLLSMCSIKKNIKINLLTKTAPNNQAKETRIFDKAPLIRTFYFLDENKRSRAYTTFMVNVYSFRVTGHNKHDDAPDSLAMAADFIERPVSAKVEVFRRPW